MLLIPKFIVLFQPSLKSCLHPNPAGGRPMAILLLWSGMILWASLPFQVA